MTKRSEPRSRWARVMTGLAVVAVAGSAIATAPAAGQQKDAPEQPEGSVLDRIERDRESLITGQHFAYDPAGRRDPFAPLVQNEKVRTGPRPQGIAGMLVTEIDLKGIGTDVLGHPVALFRGSDNRGYTLLEGDIVYDARLISIDVGDGVVVFRQDVDDPRRIKPYRDVTKRLNPQDEDAETEESS